MGDSEDGDLAESLAELSVVDELKSKHRKELKELEAKSAKLRHSVPKGDKKKLKEVKEEITKMETELKKRQEQELKNAQATATLVDGEAAKNSTKERVEEPATVSKVEDGVSHSNEEHENARTAGTTRAQRRRDKKAAVATQSASNTAQTENAVELLREAERSKLASKLESLGLAIHDVAPNGDCLFGSVVHQMEILHGIATTVPALRLQAAEVMRSNIDDYLPFMDHDTDEGGFYMYCQKMETTHEWGGHMELKALSHALGLPIRVVQADGPDVELLPSTNARAGARPPLIITFHRHEFGLGEHYNSTEPWENVK